MFDGTVAGRVVRALYTGAECAGFKTQLEQGIITLSVHPAERGYLISELGR